MKRFLITTADERTWRRDRPVLFLGEWCRLYDRRPAWAGLDAEVVPYHWDDREQLHADYERIDAAYERLLRSTADALNEQHGTDHSTRYWRILLGPWLILFTHALFDRWAMVRKAADGYAIDETLISDSPLTSLIPTAEFPGDLYQDTTWNHLIFGRAIEYENRIPFLKISTPWERPAMLSPPVRPTLRRVARSGIRRGLSSVLARFGRSDEAMIIASRLPRLEEVKLQLALGQVPKFWGPPTLDAVAPDLARRRQFRVRSDGADPFVQFAASLIPDQMPTVYLEGYRKLKEAVQRLRWPSRPRVIFTSNLDHLCSVFQEWAASKAEAGHPLVIGQHGGFVGIARRHPTEDHQLRICDRYLSWGRRDDHPRVHPGVVLSNVRKPMATWNPSGNLLLVTYTMRLFALRCMSQPVGPSQSAAFVAEQIRFAGALSESIRASLTFRINEEADRRVRTGYIERWKEAFPDVRIDPSTTPIEGPMRQCRLFVYTYNSTGYLETLARNVPTLMFWNPSYFELRASAQPYFDLLEDARIFHRTPESAATHVTDIWEDVAGWWNRPEVQRARRRFCEQFALTPDDPIRVLKEALLTVPAGIDPQEAVV